MAITTSGLRLRAWERTDRDAFAALHTDPAVMHDHGGPISRTASDAKLDRYAMAYRQHGFCRRAVETRDGAFLGCTGIMPSRDFTADYDGIKAWRGLVWVARRGGQMPDAGSGDGSDLAQRRAGGWVETCDGRRRNRPGQTVSFLRRRTPALCPDRADSAVGGQWGGVCRAGHCNQNGCHARPAGPAPLHRDWKSHYCAATNTCRLA